MFKGQWIQYGLNYGRGETGTLKTRGEMENVCRQVVSLTAPGQCRDNGLNRYQPI